jgi:Kef-type K+ transport system membrane component KefB
MLPPAAPTSEHLVLTILVAVAVVAVVARLGGALLERVGQPSVIGELGAGIVLGPTVLGLFPGNLDHVIFADTARPALNAIAQLGLVIFVFLIGLELDMSAVRRRRRAATAIAASSFGLPFALGVLAAIPLYAVYGQGAPAQPAFLAFALFLGTALSVTAVPVLARLLTHTRLRETELGALALTCATLQDAAAWGVLAVALGVATGSGIGGGVVAIGWGVLLVVVMIGVVRPILAHAVQRRAMPSVASPTLLVIAVAGTAMSAALSGAAGLHFVLGAFLFGVAFPRNRVLRARLMEQLSPMTHAVLLPVFFFLPGLQVNLRDLDGRDLGTLAMICAIACVGKFVGTAAAARPLGMSWRETGMLGVLMNTRGMVELIVLNVGLAAGVIAPRLYAVLVIMAIATTLMAGPLMRLLQRRTECQPSKAAALPTGQPTAQHEMLIAQSHASADR